MTFTLALTLLVVCMLIVDLTQTLKIKNNPNLHEINKILGPHPSDTNIYVYFILVIGLFIASILLIPGYETLKVVWAVAWIVVEGWAIRNNIKLGLGL